MTAPGADFWAAAPPVPVPVPGAQRSPAPAPAVVFPDLPRVPVPAAPAAVTLLLEPGPRATSPAAADSSLPAPLRALNLVALAAPAASFDDIVAEEPVDPPASSRRAHRVPRTLATRIRVGVGELLITCALLTGLYVLWLLWWTDVESEQAHEQIVASLDWVDTGFEATERALPRTDASPSIAEPEHGATFAVMYVPRWGFEYASPVTQGVDRPTVLDTKGIGHYPGTAMPGQVGNFAVAAHRTTYGKPFNRVEDLQSGDPLIVQTDGTWYVYRVTSTEVVRPSDVNVIAPVPGDPNAEATQRTITLTTCHPMFSARQRFIVHGELDYWLPAAAGAPDELTGEEA